MIYGVRQAGGFVLYRRCSAGGAGQRRFYMRLAAIDIGTNSLHMVVVRVRPDFSFEIIDREKDMVRLGAGGLDGRALTPDAMHAALQVLSKFARLAESHAVDEIVAVATSADSRGGKRRRIPAGRRRADRHPRARHPRHRRSAAHSPGGAATASTCPATSRSSSTSAAAASRSRAARVRRSSAARASRSASSA